MSTTATPISTAPPTGNYTADPVHSSVGFEVKHMISTFRSSFRDFEARLEAGDEGISLAGSADVASVDVRDENLAAHLQSPEFFDAERAPRIRFASERIEVDDSGSLRLEGGLEIRGVSRPVEAIGKLEHVGADLGGGDRIGLDLEATVDRRDYGIEWNAPLPKGGLALGDDVKLVVSLELVPEGE